VLTDYVKDYSTTAGDYAWVIWDQKNDGGSKPMTDDYGLTVSYMSGSSYDVLLQQGTGTGWGAFEPASSSGITAASSSDAVNDPYAGTKHVIYEFRMPRELIDNSSVITKVGFYTGAYDGGDNMGISSPRIADYRDPNSWGALTFSVPVPEFQEAYLVVATLLGASLFVLRRGKKNARVSLGGLESQPS